MPETRRLGDFLRESGCIDDADLARALETQRREGGRLGEHLLHEGKIGHLSLVSALARQKGLRTGHHDECALGAEHLRAQDLPHYLQLKLLPWRLESGRLLIGVVEPTLAARAFIQQRYGADAEILLISPRDWRVALERHFSAALSDRATNDLFRRFPGFSARRQKGDIRMLATFALLGFALILAPFSRIAYGTVLLLANLCFLGSLALRASLLHLGKEEPTPWVIPERAEWPIYTILVPLYREARMLPRLLAAIEALDYPKSRLDVKWIFEADDPASYEAACRLKPPAYIELLRVPVSSPRTKPKACNYALLFAKGPFVTIYDAEDRPEETQLKKAVLTFEKLSPEVSCLQARLMYENRNENWLTELFSLEYALLFRRLIPGLHRAGIPIPLGGTSNHLRLSALKWVGGWDPHNVTEDADLGLRLAAAGYRTAPLDSFTREEAPLRIIPWIRQRTRWIKGYLVTWTVHNRDARGLKDQVGKAAFVGLQLFIGGSSLIYLIAPILWLQCVASLAYRADLPGWIFYLSLSTLLCGFWLQWQSAYVIVKQEAWSPMRRAICLFPFYWFLHSWAALRAFGEFFRCPYYWDKTEHGLSRQINFKGPA